MGPDPSITPELIQAQAFTTGFRGYDHGEVREFLARVAGQFRALMERADQLERAWHSAEERAARPPSLDEDDLIAAVGEETATILRTARATAAELRAKAAAEAEAIVAEAHSSAEQIRAEAEGVHAREVRAAEEAAGRIFDEAKGEAAAVVEKARSESGAMRAAAEQERTLTIEGATHARDRILEDLSRRRRVATVQIEQLRAGRERLLEAYGVVRRTLEEAHNELTRADAEARAAADEAGRRMQRELADPNRPDPFAPAASNDPQEAAHDGEAGEASGESADMGTAHPETAHPETARPETARPETAHSETARPETGEPEAGHVETGEAATHGGPADDAPGQPPQASNPVDAVFARIRAGRAAPDTAVAASDTEASDLPATPEAGPTDPETGRPDVDEGLLERREAALADIEVSMGRRLKRAMQDEQNSVLDLLRGLRGQPGADQLLPDRGSQLGRYSDAVRSLVEGAARAGASFAAEQLHLNGADRPGEGLEKVADEVISEPLAALVDGLRRRLGEAVASVAGEEQGVVVEAIGSAYREWKSRRVETLAGDLAVAGFSAGTLQVAPEDASLRWVVEDPAGPCPDCDDDALAGELGKGEAFPTGQQHPPAHSGCRCLLVPIAT